MGTINYSNHFYTIMLTQMNKTRFTITLGYCVALMVGVAWYLKLNLYDLMGWLNGRHLRFDYFDAICLSVIIATFMASNIAALVLFIAKKE